LLDKQINIYSIDTGHFYSNREKYLHDMNCKYRSERNFLSNKIAFFDQVMTLYGYTKKDLLYIKKGKIESLNIISDTTDLLYEYFYWHMLISHKQKKANESKTFLLSLLKNKVSQNELTNGHDHLRKVRENSIKDCNVISVFDSALSRTIGIKQDELSDSLMVVQVYYFDVFKDLSFYGFLYNQEKYIYFTSSAGQIRTKKTIFIKESVWNRIQKTVMCGLTLDKINARGGNNVNKHLAYMALTNSATDLWEDFDIDKTIVIDDFETNVFGTFDYINDSDYSIARKTDYVPINHTDGAGMMLPTVSKKNFMFRAPWVKGLLGVFDFRKFIEVHQCSPLIIDLYGQEHDVIKEDIQIILTKSQFKMYKYYDSWTEYKHYYKLYQCTSGICNIEESRIKPAKINYQMLQTLTDITDEEIDLLTVKSSTKINTICQSRETMMNILGITPYNTSPTPFQKAVKHYPPLLSDPYVKDILREVKDSLLKKYRSGKIEITGKYTFLLPDYYAACEYWFKQNKQPEGLLNDGEVFCKLFKQYSKLDCLRSPHLYKEHAIRSNTAYTENETRSTQIQQWFTTDGIYTSTYDLISKILQFDVDGDKSLVIADPDFVEIAERNMNDIVPLYYNMKKADPAPLNNKTIYSGLNAAFTHGNIGIYSNDISKIWNNDVFTEGSEKEKMEALVVIKLLCMENNFCIDSAKTLYMPQRPKWFKSVVAKYTKGKLPAFFEYAKDKEKHQLEKRNKSFVNEIYSRIPNQSINTRSLKLGDIDYHLLMRSPDLICSKEVSSLYNDLSRSYRYMVNTKDDAKDNMRYVACQIKERFSQTGYADETIADMLTEYLYKQKKRYKQLLWFCYGEYIVQHLEKNIPLRKTKFIQCVDCGEWLEVDALNTKTCRCEKCRRKHVRDYDRKRKLMKKS
jgi:hypothetical protein